MKIEINLNFTEAALKELKRAKKAGDFEDDSLVRVAATAGGCSGFMYNMKFVSPDEIDEKNDFIEDRDGLNVVTDRKSLLLLDGTTVDWIDDLTQRGFAFKNPNAQSSCGCGQSFS